MTFVEVRTYNGVRFALDAYGQIWRELRMAPAGRPHWICTSLRSFERLEAVTSFRLYTNTN